MHEHPHTPTYTHKHLHTHIVRQTYERELHYGHINTFIGKVLLFGIAGSGKTSVMAIMMGDDPPQVRESTSLMARPVQVITVLLDDLTKWEKKTPEEVRRRIAEIIRSRELHKTDLESTHSESTASESTASTVSEASTDQQIQNQLTRESEQVKEETLLSPEFNSLLKKTVKEDNFLSLVHDSNQSTEPILEQRWLYIIDSGGQPEFHNMLSIFVQNTTACIFVFRMHEELDDCPLVAYFKDGKSLGSYQSKMTNRQTFKQFICTMRSFSTKKNGFPPKILLLATHRDQVEEGALPDLLEERRKQLKSIVLPQFQHQLIYCDERLVEFIFTMNAKKPESKDRATANTIRDRIKEMCSGKKEKVPLRWHTLDDLSRSQMV